MLLCRAISQGNCGLILIHLNQFTNILCTTDLLVGKIRIGTKNRIPILSGNSTKTSKISEGQVNCH